LAVADAAEDAQAEVMRYPDLGSGVGQCRCCTVGELEHGPPFKRRRGRSTQCAARPVLATPIFGMFSERCRSKRTWGRIMRFWAGLLGLGVAALRVVPAQAAWAIEPPAASAAPVPAQTGPPQPWSATVR